MILKQFAISTTALAALVALGGCGTPSDDSGSSMRGAVTGTAHATGDASAVVATYGGKTFTAQDFLDEVGKLNKRSRKALEDSERRRQFVDNFILSSLIFQEGKKKGFDQDPSVRKQIEDLERRLVIQKVMQEHQSAPVSDEEVKAYYDGNPDEFRTDRVKASHILVKEEELAKELHGKLKADSSQFAELAKEHSIDKSNAARGGDLGFFGRGRMVPEFEEAAFGLTEDGGVSEIVKTRFGYHIIIRVEREDGAPKAFDEVKNQIRVRMINEARRGQTESFLEDLKKDAGYELNDKALADVDISELLTDETPDVPAAHPGL
jgi:peptidyl-prolyl cis-trans isomerase C